ncbi:hypothetical protein HDU96_001694, partial [Phlyctochytrium bullatum]
IVRPIASVSLSDALNEITVITRSAAAQSFLVSEATTTRGVDDVTLVPRPVSISDILEQITVRASPTVLVPSEVVASAATDIAITPGPSAAGGSGGDLIPIPPAGSVTSASSGVSGGTSSTNVPLVAGVTAAAVTLVAAAVAFLFVRKRKLRLSAELLAAIGAAGYGGSKPPAPVPANAQPVSTNAGSATAAAAAPKPQEQPRAVPEAAVLPNRPSSTHKEYSGAIYEMDPADDEARSRSESPGITEPVLEAENGSSPAVPEHSGNR